jgi:peroxiredoxin
MDTEGRELALEDFRGKIVVLNFWAAWCAACDGDLRTLARVQDRHRDKVAVVGISFQSGNRAQVAEFGRRIGGGFPLLLGTREVIDRYGVATYPTTFILDREGILRYCVFNPRPERFWEELLATLR